MDWFERIAGFREGSYEETVGRLHLLDGRLRSDGVGPGRSVGILTLPSVSELRSAVEGAKRRGRSRLSIVEGDVRAMHALPENRGALFQVASQFNMLEMVGPQVTPEHGVTGYQHDRTQGPACAMAAGAATIYRNYLVPVGAEIGQRSDRQLDGLADLGSRLARLIGTDVEALWTMRNGYALATREGLARIVACLGEAEAKVLDELRGSLRVGLHRDVEVTDGSAPGPLVSQVFCSALPVAYSGLPESAWTPFARLVLKAAYEATMLAGVLNAARGASDRVLLTRLGGGAFGNADAWIDDAMLRALRLVEDRDLDVAIVSYGRAPASLRSLVGRSGLEHP